MPTLKFTIKGVEFQYVGDQDEVVSFIKRFLSESVTLPAQAKQVSPKTSIFTQRIGPEEIIDKPIPSDEKVIEYITSKPDFSHDLFDVQTYFFGITFKSRGKEQRMYHRTARQLRMVRQVIEKQHDGKFKAVKGAKRGLKRFVFKKSPTANILG